MSDERFSASAPRDASHPDAPAEQNDTSSRSDPPVSKAPKTSELPREYGGRKGPEPVRYGDWEKNGRCIDF